MNANIRKNTVRSGKTSDLIQTELFPIFQDKIARLPDGQVGYAKWLPENPHSLIIEPDFTNVGLIVHQAGSLHPEGMNTEAPSFGLRPLCEK